MQCLAYVVGSRVDGLYDGNSDDMWYPGRIQRVHSSDDTDNASYEVVYDDGEIETHVLPQFLRFHVSGTLSVGTRVFGRYAGGDEWYPGKVTEVQENGCYTIEYDDSEVETDVPLEFIKEPTEASFEPTAGDSNEQEAEAVAAGTPDKVAMVSVDDEPVDATAPEVAVLDMVEPTQAVDSTPASHKDAEEVSSPQSVDGSATSMSEPQQRVVTIPHQQQQQQPVEVERPRFHAKPKPIDNDSAPSSSQPHHQQRSQSESTGQHQFETDEYASIVESIELLGKRLGDAASIKAVLSTLVKQMRTFPQVTADLVHSRNGEKLVIDVLKFHDSHAVIQCYCFVLLRRLCFLCAKSTHFFLRNEIIDFVTGAMRRFAEDAILQASACGALAVFTRVHAGLNLLLEHRVAQLVLATIVYHKTYSIHTRQVHYYACEGTHSLRSMPYAGLKHQFRVLRTSFERTDFEYSRKPISNYFLVNLLVPDSVVRALRARRSNDTGRALWGPSGRGSERRVAHLAVALPAAPGALVRRQEGLLRRRDATHVSRSEQPVRCGSHPAPEWSA